MRRSLPSKDQIVRVLGDDGGAICDDPSERTAQGDALLDDAATAPRARACGRSIADTRAVQGQLAVIQVYCPDELEDFKSYVSDLKYDDVVNRVSAWTCRSASPT